MLGTWLVIGFGVALLVFMAVYFGTKFAATHITYLKLPGGGGYVIAGS